MDENILDIDEEDIEMIYAGFWERVAAFVIDLVVMYGFSILFVVISFAVLYTGRRGSASVFSLLPIIWLVFNWLYFAILESSSYQGTLGKRLLKIKVVDYQGERISFLRASLRHLGRLISMLVLFAGLIAAAFSDTKQGLHDVMAQTHVKKRLPNLPKVVVEEKENPAPSE